MLSKLFIRRLSRLTFDSDPKTMTGGEIVGLPEIADNFEAYRNKSMLYGQNMNDWIKHVIMSIVRHIYDKFTITDDTTLSKEQKNIVKCILRVLSDNDIDYDKFMKSMNVTSNEGLFSYLLEGSKSSPEKDLMVVTVYTFGRIAPLKTMNEWYDNFRLTAMLHQLELTTYKHLDSKYSFSIDYEPVLSNEGTKLNYSKVKKYLVNPLREFIIKHNLYPSNNINWKRGNVENGNSGETLTDKEVVDKCYENFPMFSLGSHGCDCFFNGYTLSLEEIRDFLFHYPSALVMSIVNTCTYVSGRGEHWMNLSFMNHNNKICVFLICSAKSNYDSFRDDNKLLNTMKELDFELYHNSKYKLQYDGKNCALYSMLSGLKLIQYYKKFISGEIDSDELLKEVCTDIGKNGENLKDGKTIEDVRKATTGSLN